MTDRQRQILLSHLRQNLGLFWGLGALGLLTAILETVSVFTVLPLAASLSKSAGADFFMWGAIFAALIALRSLALLTHARLSATASADAIHEAKTKVLRAYASTSDEVILELKSGKVAQALFRGANSSGAIVLNLPQLIAEAVRAIALAGLLLWLDFRMAVVLILAGALFWVTFSRLLSSRAYSRSRDRAAAEARQSMILHELLQGARQLRLAGALGPWRERFAQISREYSRHHGTAMTLQILPKVWFDACAALVILGWMLAAAWQGPGRATVDLPLLATVVLGAGKLMPCLAAIGRNRLEILAALPDVEAMADLIARCPQADTGAGRRRADMRSGLKVAGVRFSYPDRTELLKGVDLDIPAGRGVAIIGPFGCGKSTLLGLLLGLHQPSSGSISLDGRPLHEFDRSTWWERVGVVPQDAFLFHGTIAENIILDRPGYGPEDVDRAAKLVGADEFIAALPQSYDTVVGERGLRLSGGQRQLVLLARALLANPAILILDEPAQGLDPQAQEQLGKALRQASRGRTVIAAMHRPDWASWADSVVYLQDGRISEVVAGRGS